ncbi:NAC domain-containing protein 91-like [Iris pallida]|uniref:NAC domain-containing protein 91-like n=1 Tax=Iris pallida TaxID=29817 RepID=A0AAX6EKZ0_IRIPA|nr:NAC domain-containing protein 91-like [Iris pallida]
MFERDSVTDLLDAVLRDPEDFLPEFPDFQTQVATELEPNGQFSTIKHDLVSGEASEMSNYLNTEAWIAQGMLAPEDPGQFFSPPLFSSDSSEMLLYQSKHALDPSLKYSCPQMESTVGMFDSNERSVCMLDSLGTGSNDTEVSGGQADLNGSGIKIRHRQHSNNPTTSSPQGMAIRRIRLQIPTVDQPDVTETGIQIRRRRHPNNALASTEHLAEQGVAARRIRLQMSNEGPSDVTETGIQIRNRQHPDNALTSTNYLVEWQGMGGRSNDELDHSENETEVKPVTSKDEQHADFTEDEDEDLSCISEQSLPEDLSFDDDDTAEAKSLCSETSEGPAPILRTRTRQATDAGVKLELPSFNRETARICRFAAIASLLFVPLYVGISWFLTS